MKCKFIKKNGKACNANAMTNSDYCYSHNPEIPLDEKRKNQSKGGKNNKIIKNEQRNNVNINNANDVNKLIAKLINKVANGELSVKVVNSIGLLLNTSLKSMEMSNIEEKLNKIIMVKNIN